VSEARKPSPEFVARLRKQLLPKPKAGGDKKQLASHCWAERQRALAPSYRQRAIDAVWKRTQQVKAETAIMPADDPERSAPDE